MDRNDCQMTLLITWATFFFLDRLALMDRGCEGAFEKKSFYLFINLISHQYVYACSCSRENVYKQIGRYIDLFAICLCMIEK